MYIVLCLLAITYLINKIIKIVYIKNVDIFYLLTEYMLVELG